MNTTNLYNLIKSTDKLKYNYSKKNAEKIGAIIFKAKETMINPIAAHYVLFVNYDFNAKDIVPRLNRVLEDKVKDSMFFYSIEQSTKQVKYKTAHIHLCLILDVPLAANADTLFLGTVLSTLQGLKNVDTNYNHIEKNITSRMWH